MGTSELELIILAETDDVVVIGDPADGDMSVDLEIMAVVGTEGIKAAYAEGDGSEGTGRRK